MGMMSRQEVVRVNGEAGANAYPLGPNSSILMLDNTAPIIWFKMTDGASYPTLTGYNISPIEKPNSTSNDEVYLHLEERIKRLEDMINDKSDISTAKPSRQKQS